MARVLTGSQFYLHTHTFNPQSEWTIPAFVFPATAGIHLLTPERRKADELARVSGYVVRQFTCPKAVTHPTTNRAQCSATALLDDVELGANLNFSQKLW